jgi:hypothetical protein
LPQALVNQDSAIPAYRREPPSESLQELVSQDDASCPISRNALGELSHSTIDILADDVKRDTQQQQQEEAEQEEQGEHGHNDQDSDESEGPRPAKRRRLTRSSRDRASKRICKRRLRQPQDSRSAPVQAPKCASSKSQRSPTHSSSDEEPTSNTRAEYQEWPMHGFFKRTTIGDEIRYGMEFSLEQLHELCALACPHASQAGSSIGSVGSSRPPAQTKKTGSGPPSQIKGTRFTQEEDAKLIDMKEIKRLFVG